MGVACAADAAAAGWLQAALVRHCGSLAALPTAAWFVDRTMLRNLGVGGGADDDPALGCPVEYINLKVGQGG